MPPRKEKPWPKELDTDYEGLDYDGHDFSSECSDYVDDGAAEDTDQDVEQGDSGELSGGDEVEDEMMYEVDDLPEESPDETGLVDFVRPAWARTADATKASGERAGQEPEPLYDQLYNGNRKPASFYHDKIQAFNIKDFQTTVYKPSTGQALNLVLYEWRMFCRVILKQPWRRTMRNIDLGILQAFFEFHLYQDRGKNGKRKRAIKCTRSLQTFRNNFTLVYRQQINEDPYIRLEKSAVHNLVLYCQHAHNLSDERKDNRPMTLDDLKLQIETTLSTTDKAFKLGEQRVLAVLFLLLVAPAGSRPDSILMVRLRDIQLALHRPKEGPVQLIIYLNLVNTKSYRGSKGTKTFIVPEVIFDPSLFLSPHVFLLAILCKRRAFMVDELNDHPGKLAELKVPEKQMQIPIPLKKDRDVQDDFLFRKTERGVFGWKLSKKRITPTTMNKWLVSIGRILGWEGSATAYTLRYMAGNNMNECVNISTALQNLVMDHAPNSDTFQKNYLNRNVTFDLWALHRGLPPQQAVVREAASFGYRRHAERPFKLSDDEAAALKLDPAYTRVAEHVAKLPRGSPQWQEGMRELKATLERLRYAATKRSIGKDWTERQAVHDIRQQISGPGQSVIDARPKQAQPRQLRPASPAQKAVLEALYQNMATTTVEGQLQRRTNAVLALIAYCFEQEPLRPKLVEDRVASAARSPSAVPTPPAPRAETRAEQVARLRKMCTVEYEDQRLKVCFFCVGHALTLPQHDPYVNQLCRSLASSSTLTRHFERSHLKFMDPSRPEPCPVCPKARFKTLEHLRSHAQEIHGIAQTLKVTAGLDLE